MQMGSSLNELRRRGTVTAHRLQAFLLLGINADRRLGARHILHGFGASRISPRHLQRTQGTGEDESNAIELHWGSRTSVCQLCIMIAAASGALAHVRAEFAYVYMHEHVVGKGINYIQERSGGLRTPVTDGVAAPGSTMCERFDNDGHSTDQGSAPENNKRAS
jgi:hypothetical protein